MAFFFGDGFDLYSTITDCGGYWDGAFGGTASLTLSASGRFTGSRGISPATIATVPYITKTSGVNDSVHHITLAFQQTATLTGSALAFFCTLYDGATAQCTIIFRSDGALLLTSGIVTGTVLATYTGAVAATNTWYAFEIEVVINNTTGSISVRKNGNTSNDFSLGSLNTRNSTNNYANKLGIGADAGTAQIIDDLLWRSDASSVAWVGDIRCWTRMPASDASVAWSRPSTFGLLPYSSGSSTGSVNANNARFSGFTSQGGSVGSVTVTMVTAPTLNMKCALFACVGSTLGATGSVGAILGTATASIANPAIGVNTFTFSPAVAISAGTLFYVGVCVDANTGGGAIGQGATAGPSATSATTYASFPLATPTLTATAQANINVSPVFTPSANFSAVADPQQDGANSYVYSSTVSQSDLYGIAAIGSTPNATIGVTTRGYLQKSDAGTRTVGVQLQSGGTNVQAPSGGIGVGQFQWVWRSDTVDPNTGSAWTASAVNAAQIGAVVTG